MASHFCSRSSDGFFATGEKPVLLLRMREGLTADGRPLRRVTRKTRYLVESACGPPQLTCMSATNCCCKTTVPWRMEGAQTQQEGYLTAC